MYTRLRHRLTMPFIVATLIAAPLALTACSGHMVFDPYAGVSTRWTPEEDGYYRSWERERGFAHQDYGRRSAGEQRQYFGWRHSHH
jgi:hypothetical protein